MAANLVLQPDFVIMWILWLVGGSGRRGRGLGVGRRHCDQCRVWTVVVWGVVAVVNRRRISLRVSHPAPAAVLVASADAAASFEVEFFLSSTV
jgi:hypothetical protein